MKPWRSWKNDVKRRMVRLGSGFDRSKLSKWQRRKLGHRLYRWRAQ